MSGGALQSPVGQWRQSIVSYLGSTDTGLMDGCLLLYRGSKSRKNADYYLEVNGDVFLDCLQKVFLAME